jgi:hypothetical protein
VVPEVLGRLFPEDSPRDATQINMSQLIEQHDTFVDGLKTTIISSVTHLNQVSMMATTAIVVD